MIKFQRTMLALREIGDRKVDLTSKMLDMVQRREREREREPGDRCTISQAEGYSQQLSLAEKDMDNCRTRDELTGTRSSGAATAHKNSFQGTPLSSNTISRYAFCSDRFRGEKEG